MREAQNGVFAGTFDVPYTKNIADGAYDVMIMAMGKNSDRAEQTVKINLAHPEFTSVAFVYGSEKINLAKSENLWSYTGELPAALEGYFEAKAGDKTYTFGGANVDNVEFGSTQAIELYSYEAAIPEGTISFDVVSFQVKIPLEALYVTVPETVDSAYPGTTDIEFKK